jgi:TfoX/Sxy family transcriptional regulator of competence genes
MIVTMAYDEDLANRIRELIASEDGYTEQKMFGGIGFMIDGHMAVGVSGEGGLMIHCSKEETEALQEHRRNLLVCSGRTTDRR